MSEHLENLQRAIRTALGVRTRHEGCVLVHEQVDGRTLWKGYVEVYAALGHPVATRVFAWGEDEGGEMRYEAFLNLPPILSPHDAVRAAMDGGSQA
jgi:hypothetical protein